MAFQVLLPERLYPGDAVEQSPSVSSFNPGSVSNPRLSCLTQLPGKWSSTGGVIHTHLVAPSGDSFSMELQ